MYWTANPVYTVYRTTESKELQYNTIFVYCEMTERSSTRDNNTKKIQYKNSNSMTAPVFERKRRVVTYSRR